MDALFSLTCTQDHGNLEIIKYAIYISGNCWESKECSRLIFHIFSYLGFQSAFQYISNRNDTQSYTHIYTHTYTKTPTHMQLFVHCIFALADYPEKEG